MEKIILFSLFVFLILVSPAFSTPVTIYSENLSQQDDLQVDGFVDELGDNFPFDEDIFPCTLEWGGHIPCPSEYSGNGQMKQVKILNQTGRDFLEVYYVADPETTLTNYDGKIGNAGRGDAGWAFRIDAIGLNTPLVSESTNTDGVFEDGEAWVFVIQDYTNTLGLAAHLFGTPGICSDSAGDFMSSGSIVAVVPEPGTVLLLGLGGLLLRRKANPK
jgi:PEP-CTERM motif-containing protein